MVILPWTLAQSESSPGAHLHGGRVGALDGRRVKAGKEGAVEHGLALGEDVRLGLPSCLLWIQPAHLVGQGGRDQGLSVEARAHFTFTATE